MQLLGCGDWSIDPYAYTYHGYSYYCNGTLIPRGTAFGGEWLAQLDASASIRLPVPDRFDAALRIDAFNILNLHQVTAYNQFGELSSSAANSYYRQPVAYQTPRYVRLTLRVGF